MQLAPTTYSPLSAALPNLKAALQQAAQAGLPRLEAHMLLLFALGRSSSDRAWLLAHDEDALPPAAAATFTHYCQRRLAGEPVAYITGHKAFYGLDLQISPAVLDPRDDTETLVDWALEVLPAASTAQVLDLGTGSGAIALAIKTHAPQAQVTAVDASAEALAVARSNASALGLALDFQHGSWFTSVAGRRFELIVSNPPYIASQDPHLPALQHEPLSALVAAEDGLADIRHIIAHAAAHLQPGGWLLLEHGHEQGAAAAALLSAAGFAAIQHRCDLAGQTRCTGGKMPASALPPS